MVGKLLLQFGLILVNAIFASAEIALLSVNSAKLELSAAGGDKRAKRLLALTKQPAGFLATIQVGITLAGFLGSAFAAESFSGLLADRIIGAGLAFPRSTVEAFSLVAITMLLSFVTLVLGELVPKRIAMQKAEVLAFAMAGFIAAISKLFFPLVWLLTRATNGLLRVFRIDPEAEHEAVTEEEIRLMVDAGSKRGAIDAGEQEIIHNVFEFDNRNAAEVMTHRINVELLRLKDSDETWEKTIMEGRHSFYPICGDTSDEIVGVLSVRDYFRLNDRHRQNVMEQAVRSANFIPETVKSDVLLKNMQRSRNHFAVVLDEYGGMSGIVTMADLLEQIVGSLDDDSTAVPYRPAIEKLDARHWLIRGSASLDRVERALGVSLPPGTEYDTFGGFVFNLLGHVPDDGSKMELEECGLVIKVTEIKERRLETAIVSLPAETAES
ncbi:MAG: hemolysin family protein [Treponema sp.]|jgi:putative hemolysin|nr:hemolysin family protein [Treponema sp.]